MSRTIKLLLCLSFIFLLFINFSFTNATEEDIDLETTIEEEQENEVVSENASDISTLSVLSPSTQTTVTPINGYEVANLSFNNILCVILISIGVILILFAIAILIRLKN